MQIGIDSFAAAYDDVSLAVSPAQRLNDLVEQIVHADQVGLDSFGVGEHHRKEYLDSALLLIMVPWTGFWDRNMFLSSYPEWRSFLTSAFTRGAVSGLGLLDCLVAFTLLFPKKKNGGRDE